jgi:hypothetical protein
MLRHEQEVKQEQEMGIIGMKVKEAVLALKLV